jgi:hypothetical protein
MRTRGGYWKRNHPHEVGHPIEARGGDGGVREELAAGIGIVAADCFELAGLLCSLCVLCESLFAL